MMLGGLFPLAAEPLGDADREKLLRKLESIREQAKPTSNQRYGTGLAAIKRENEDSPGDG